MPRRGNTAHGDALHRRRVGRAVLCPLPNARSFGNACRLHGAHGVGTVSHDALQNVVTRWVTRSGAYALESHKQTGAALRVGATDAGGGRDRRRVVPAVPDLAPDRLPVAQALPGRETGRVEGPLAPAGTGPCPDGPYLAGTVEAAADAPEDVGSTEAAAHPREEVRNGRPAVGVHAGPLAQAVGAGARTTEAQARSGGPPPVRAPGPALPRGLDGGFQGLVSDGGRAAGRSPDRAGPAQPLRAEDRAACRPGTGADQAGV